MKETEEIEMIYFQKWLETVPYSLITPKGVDLAKTAWEERSKQLKSNQSKTQKVEVSVNISDMIPLVLYEKMTHAHSTARNKLADAKETILSIQAEYDMLREMKTGMDKEYEAKLSHIEELAKNRAATIDILKFRIEELENKSDSPDSPESACLKPGAQ